MFVSEMFNYFHYSHTRLIALFSYRIRIAETFFFSLFSTSIIPEGNLSACKREKMGLNSWAAGNFLSEYWRHISSSDCNGIGDDSPNLVPYLFPPNRSIFKKKFYFVHKTIFHLHYKNLHIKHLTRDASEI